MRIGRRNAKSRSKHTPSTVTTTTTPASKSSTTKHNYSSKTGKKTSTSVKENVTPGVTTSTSTPSVTETEQIPASGGINIGYTHAGTAILLATTLFIFAEWNTVFAGILKQAIPNNQAFSSASSPDYKLLIGGVVFIGLIGIIASTGPTGSSIMIWMLIAMWLLFIMFNGAKTMHSVLGWLTPSQSSTSNSNTPNQTNTSTNTSSNTTTQ